jgi:uncharacterized protein (DUF305 family)
MIAEQACRSAVRRLHKIRLTGPSANFFAASVKACTLENPRLLRPPMHAAHRFTLETFFENDSMQWQAFIRTQMKISSGAPKRRLYSFCRKQTLHVVGIFAALCGMLLATSAYAFPLCFTVFSYSAMWSQQTDAAKPVVVQPGAPGQPSKMLPPSTKAALPPRSPADVEFMQGMIMHHSQAVEMTALIASHTENKELRSLGARISSSQSDEIRFMQRWLAARGESLSMATSSMKTSTDSTHAMAGMEMSREPMALMPGMLSPEQMEALRKAKGAEFDHLFLVGMIQHHDGALTMVKDLFDTAGAGQDAELFNFATDADNSQRAEIKIMQTMLEIKSSEEEQ